jgi:hypothetical protein
MNSFWDCKICQDKDETIRKLRSRVAQLEEEDRQWQKLSLVKIVEENDTLRSQLTEWESVWDEMRQMIREYDPVGVGEDMDRLDPRKKEGA